MKLLVSDLDGTLYPKSGENSEKQFLNNIKAVKEWLGKGNKFAVATARGIGHYEELCGKLGFKVDFIGGNGSEMVLSSGEIILKEFPCSIFIDLCKYVQENDINASVTTIKDGWYWSSKDCYPIKNAPVQRKVWEHIRVAKLGEMDSEMGLQRIAVLTPPENRETLKKIIANRNYDVHISTSDIDTIDIGPKNSSKGIAIHELCDYYAIDRNQVIVVGDSNNDIPMFEITDKSYCICHAELEVLNKASRIVESVKEVIAIELEK